jgi:hypothetical protein
MLEVIIELYGLANKEVVNIAQSRNANQLTNLLRSITVIWRRLTVEPLLMRLRR